MSLLKYSKEELNEMSLVEVAYELLTAKKQSISFMELMDELTKLLDLSEQDVRTKIAQFYTDLNIDGRFLCHGDNQWGLRVWYPVDQVTEEIVNPVKAKKKKKAKKVVDDDLEFDDLEIEEEDLDGFDDLDDDLDDEDLEDDLDEDVEEDLAEDLDDDLLDDDLEEVIDEELDEELEEDEFEVEEDDDLDDLSDDDK